jgi:hypothetical protein
MTTVTAYPEKSIDSFVEELNRYSGRLHTLYSGLTDLDIQKLETELDISLPETYIQLLKKFNGATLFFCDVEIWGMIKDAWSKSDNPAYDLIEQNLVMRSQGYLSSSYLVIGNYSYGSLICFDLKAGDKKDCPVIEWEPDIAQATNRWDNLISWLFHELAEGETAFNYDGSEKSILR